MRPHKFTSERDSSVRIALIDAEPAALFGLRMYFQEIQNFRVCCEALSSVKAEFHLNVIEADLIVVDPELDGGGGLHLIGNIRRNRVPARCVAWLRRCDFRNVRAALKAGADAVVGRHEPLDELLLASIVVISGYRHMSVSACIAVEKGITASELVNEAACVDLPARQNQVFRLLGEGLDSSTIAMRLGVSLKTVQSHIERLKRRLNCRSQTELYRKATISTTV